MEAIKVITELKDLDKLNDIKVETVKNEQTKTRLIKL